ncbi:class I SAM-dependent methyltransferase [Nonomuraea sediminis]|uniref:class I SAM-dependent methyltransferase n=1 Tax=Nonomuraea sediminis TaxID=2835864 RepID=UPI001BDD8303|nr:class I SAM-dependent methyltransferase [Nonomuraea sediminis]
MTDLFGGAAPYYVRYRTDHGEEAIDHLGRALDGTVLDLGCGPGTVAIPLAAHVREVIAVDPDEEMLAEGRSRSPGNVRWLLGDSTRIRALPPFDHVVMGRSFHWMDRVRLLEELDDLLPPGGAVALIGPGRNPEPEPWGEVTQRLRERFGLGELAARGSFQATGLHPHDLLAVSAFPDLDIATFETSLTRDVESVIGLQLSYSFSSPAKLGDRLPAFMVALREALLADNPSGLWVERVVTEVLMARRYGSS